MHLLSWFCHNSELWPWQVNLCMLIFYWNSSLCLFTWVNLLSYHKEKIVCSQEIKAERTWGNSLTFFFLTLRTIACKLWLNCTGENQHWMLPKIRGINFKIDKSSTKLFFCLKKKQEVCLLDHFCFETTKGWGTNQVYWEQGIQRPLNINPKQQVELFTPAVESQGKGKT